MKITRMNRIVRPLLVALTCLALFVATFVPTSHAQQRRNISRPNKSAAPAMMPRAKRNADIARIVSEIDARNIERTIRKLVSFGTRNTLSSQDNPTRGIGAARDWLYSEFQKVAAASGGR